MQTTVNKRTFVYNGNRLTDPDVAMSPAAIKDFYSAMYPELLNAEIQGPEKVADDLVWTFHRTTGTKGAVKTAAKPKQRRIVPNHSVSPFARRLDSAAGETYTPTMALPMTELSTLMQHLTPVIGSQAMSLPSRSFALLL